MDRKNATRASRYVFEKTSCKHMMSYFWRYFFQVGRQCAGAIVVPKPEEGEAVHVVGEDSKAVGMALRESIDWHRGVDIQRGRLPPQHHVLNVNENDQKDDRNDWGEQGVA